MALKPCRECGTEVSTEAESCPRCGIARPAKADGLMDIRPGNGAGNYAAKKKRRRWGLWLGVGIVLFWLFGGFIWVLNVMGVDTDTLLSNAVPKCSSKMALDLAKQAIEGSPVAKVINVTAYEFNAVEEIAYDPNTQKRTCKAMAFLNSGKREI